MKGNYENGYKSGSWETFHKNGQLWFKEIYKEGELDGVSLEYYENGLLRSKGNFKKGEPDGIYEEYHENGLLLCIGNVNEEEDLWKYFDERGNPDKSEESKMIDDLIDKC